MKPSDQITKRIADSPPWQGKILGRLRALIHKADPDITEEWKWDTPVYSHNGLVCATGSFKDSVGLNVFKGASLKDPRRMFNSGLEAKTSRMVKLAEGDSIDEAGLVELIRAAVALNSGGPKKVPGSKRNALRKSAPRKGKKSKRK